MTAQPVATAGSAAGAEVRVLGAFALRLPDGRFAGPWERPSARRLIQLLAVRPGHSIGRDEVVEVFFGGLTPARAANALSKSLSFARRAAAPFHVIAADRSMLALGTDVVVDVDRVRAQLTWAMQQRPGDERDAALMQATSGAHRLLEDELYADWAIPHRDELDRMRSEARLALAADRQAGFGRTGQYDVAAAWNAVLLHDPANEVACIGAMRSALATGDPARAWRTYRRTCSALEDLDLEPSQQLLDVAADLGEPEAEAPGGLGEAESTPEAVRAAVIAAGAARRRLAGRAARSLLQRAVHVADSLEPRPPDLRPVVFNACVQLGELSRDAEDVAEAASHLERALSEARSDIELAVIWSALGSLPYRRGDMAAAIECYERGLVSLAGDEPSARVRLLTELGFALGRLGRDADCLATLTSACAALEDGDDPLLAALALDHHAVALHAAGRIDESLVSFDRAFDAAGPLGDEGALMPLHLHRAAARSDAGRTGEALADLSVAIRIATADGNRYAVSVAHWVRSRVYEKRGEIELALAEREQELALLDEIGNDRNTANAEAARTRLLVQLGRSDEASAAADRARSAARACGDRQVLADVDAELGAAGHPPASPSQPG